jgi:hypothetical protein
LLRKINLADGFGKETLTDFLLLCPPICVTLIVGVFLPSFFGTNRRENSFFARKRL